MPESITISMAAKYLYDDLKKIQENGSNIDAQLCLINKFLLEAYKKGFEEGWFLKMTTDNPQTTLDDKDKLILALLNYAEHSKSCSYDRPWHPECDCGLEATIEKCKEIGYV